MSFTDQKQRIATKEEASQRWGGREGIRCYICGEKVLEGEKFRWVYAGLRHTINFMVCGKCDCEDVLEKWIKHHDHVRKTGFWMEQD